MSITITLDPAAEKELGRKAALVGLSPEQYATRIVEQTAVFEEGSSSDAVYSDIPPSPEEYKSGPELVAAIEALGLSGEWGDSTLTSAELARKLRKQAETRS